MNSKCRYERKLFSGDDIRYLVKCQKTLGQHISPFSSKKFEDEYKWKNDIIRHMDVLSANEFFYLLESDVPKCKGCKNTLSSKEYSYGARKLGFKGFKKYCSICKANEPWKSREKSPRECKSISDGLRRWAKTKDGKTYYKIVSKRNQEFMLKFSNTPEGKRIREESKPKQSASIKERIRGGQFTPNITNSWTHWDATVKIDGKIRKYRSSWEACFAVCHPEYKYETLRIPYGDGKTYIGDFYDDPNRVLYEIKPRKTYNAQVYKITSVIEWCMRNRVKFVWINEQNILKYVDCNKIFGYNEDQYDKMLKGIKYAK